MSNNTYSSQSEKKDFIDYNKEQSEYNSETKISMVEVDYKTAKPVRVTIKARLIND